MPRQNIWTDEELENLFEGYLASQQTGSLTDIFSMDDFEDDDDTFAFLDEADKPKRGRPKKLNIEVEQLITNFFKQ